MKKRKIILSVATLFFAFLMLTSCGNNKKYNDAIKLMEKSKYSDAQEIFQQLDGYKDSLEKIEECQKNKFKEKIKNASVGDTITLGKYEQDNIQSNGKEDIEWIVLDIKDNKALVISKYALDYKKYHTTYTNITWGTCSLCEWLCEDFLDSYFSSEERNIIFDAQEKVFLLNASESKKYFKNNAERKCAATKYAIASGAYSGDAGNCVWWLRSEGYAQKNTAYVNDLGEVIERLSSILI